eukprot:scaffold95666_cov33-Tisochrysis_lutea.AAC.2
MRVASESVAEPLRIAGRGRPSRIAQHLFFTLSPNSNDGRWSMVKLKTICPLVSPSKNGKMP